MLVWSSTSPLTSLHRFIAQAAHLAEMHLGESGLDFGEQQWGVAVSLDLDFDTLVAGIGFTKQTLATLAKDPGAPCRPLPGTS